MRKRLQRIISNGHRNFHDWTVTGLLGLTHLLVVEAWDTEESIAREAGFSPLTNPIDNARYGSPCFRAHHDWFENHGAWQELIFTVGNDGFAFVLFIDAEVGDEQLRSLCRTCAADLYATEGTCRCERPGCRRCGLA